MHPPHGPREITKTRQVTLPKKLMQAVNLEVGDQVYLQLHDDPPGSLLITPVEVVVTDMERTRKAARSKRGARRR